MTDSAPRPQKVERRGGYRPNAGRKPGKNTTLSSYQVARMLRTARRYAKQYGKSLDDLLMEFAYDPNGKVTDRLTAIKVFKDLTMAKISEDGPIDKALAPAVFLPEQRPQLGVVNGGKVA